MQDDSRELSQALSNTPHARLHAREAAQKLSHYTRKAVETSAESAARENRTPLDACPYRPDYAPLEFEHWRAVFIKEGGTW